MYGRDNICVVNDNMDNIMCVSDNICVRDNICVVGTLYVW